MITTNKPAAHYPRAMGLTVGLALLAALAYVLINLKILAVGDVKSDEGSTTIAYIAAGSYFLGGLLILLRRRWLWIIGAAINALVILFFLQLYMNRPAVLFSPGGLISKVAQLLLEVGLIYLIITDWRRSRRQPV
jgi:hypothetical protein